LNELALEHDLLKENSKSLQISKSQTSKTTNNSSRLSNATTTATLTKSKSRKRGASIGTKLNNLGGTRASMSTTSTATGLGGTGMRLTRKELVAEQEFIKKNGTRRIKLRIKVLYAGYKTLIERLDQEIDGTLRDCFISLNLDPIQKFMSNEQLELLNPLCIKLDKCLNMPNKPLNYSELRLRCAQVYCSYKFLNEPEYKTLIRLNHEKDLYFNDINVYLIGLMNKEELKEFFYKSFEIQIHDRDRNLNNNNFVSATNSSSLNACLFGQDKTLDENISNVNLAASKHTLYNPFESKNKFWDPFGTAKLDLSDLIFGKRMLKYSVPVLPCNAPDLISNNKNNSGNNSIQAGEYLDSNTQFKLTIWVSKQPIFASSPSNQINQQCVFSRIVIRVCSRNLNIIRLVQASVIEINSRALKINNQSLSVQEAALSTYKLTK
jgi:hypothetical protein